jgi:hypothetical protein
MGLLVHHQFHQGMGMGPVAVEAGHILQAQAEERGSERTGPLQVGGMDGPEAIAPLGVAG